MNKIRNLKVWIAFAIVAVTVVVTLVLYRSLVVHEADYSFYYPDMHMTRLLRENRQLPTQKDPMEPFEVKLVREYCLGPLDYRTKWLLDDQAALESAYVIMDTNKTMILNFNEKFLDQLDQAIQTKNRDLEWFFKGLSETLRANTKVKRYFILVNHHMIRKTLGEIRFDRAIRVIPEKKTVRAADSGAQ